MITYEGKNVPIKSWCENPEEGALDQARNLASLPFVFKQVCLMPDTHSGYGMPIGGVIATRNVVIPNAVGVDIGCGMCAVKTTLNDITSDQIKELFGAIRYKVPVGFKHREREYNSSIFDSGNFPYLSVILEELSSARKQLGTLGGGNHFIEIQKGDDGHIWIMIHSGSRNFGLKIANHYNKLAQELCTMWYSDIPPIKGQDGLAFLPLNTNEGRNYMDAMNYALRFARENRRIMMRDIQDIFETQHDIKFTEEINIHHNYASIENHFGHNVVVHRKGATSAKEGQLGIIPGSQGTCSYIVKGKGNINSFMSCSHGAGRKMSRKKAKNELNLEEEIKKMNDKGIVHSIRHKDNLDEASSAYKDIDVVMEEQKDLVDIVVKLTPLGVIKG